MSTRIYIIVLHTIAGVYGIVGLALAYGLDETTYLKTLSDSFALCLGGLIGSIIPFLRVIKAPRNGNEVPRPSTAGQVLAFVVLLVFELGIMAVLLAVRNIDASLRITLAGVLGAILRAFDRSPVDSPAKAKEATPEPNQNAQQA